MSFLYPSPIGHLPNRTKPERGTIMATIKVKGIILAENNMGDYDKMVTMLTPNLGKISCAAKGARRQSSSLLAGTQLFCFGDYLLYQGTNTYHINSCETIEMFYSLRTDLDKLKYAMHIQKIISEVTEENENSYRILQLLLNTLYMIAETDQDLDFILSVFKLRLLCLLGYTPRINGCLRCQTKEKLTHFSLRDNGFICEPCSKTDKSAMNMLESTKLAIQYVATAPPKKLYSFQLKEEASAEFKLIVKVFFDEKMEKQYRVDELF